MSSFGLFLLLAIVSLMWDSATIYIYTWRKAIPSKTTKLINFSNYWCELMSFNQIQMWMDVMMPDVYDHSSEHLHLQRGVQYKLAFAHYTGNLHAYLVSFMYALDTAGIIIQTGLQDVLTLAHPKPLGWRLLLWFCACWPNACLINGRESMTKQSLLVWRELIHRSVLWQKWSLLIVQGLTCQTWQ